MLKKIISFIVLSYGFISSNDAAEMCNLDNNKLPYNSNVQFPEFSCPINYSSGYCVKVMDFVSDLVSKYMFSLQDLIEDVISFKEYNYTLQVEINCNRSFAQNNAFNTISACTAGQIFAKNRIANDIKNAFNIIDWVRCTIKSCENYLDVTKKDYFSRMDITVTDEDSRPDIDVMKSEIDNICDDIFKSCMQVDKIYYKTNVDVILDKLINFSIMEFRKYMCSWSDTYLSSFNSSSSKSRLIVCADAKSEIRGAYYYIDYLMSIIRKCEMFLTSLSDEIGVEEAAARPSIELKLSIPEVVCTSDEEKNKYDNLKCECCFNETDEDYSDDELEESYTFKDTQNSPTEEVQNLIRKHSKGKNKKDPLVKKSRDKKHYGYSEKKSNYDNTENSDRKSSYDNVFSANKKSNYGYEYNPDDMFNTLDDIYSTFIQR